jgi:hypothetical protein
MLQVTYWIDIPDQATSTTWAKVWSDASSQGGQAVSGVGDAAFVANGRLTFRKDGTYVTIEAIGTYLKTGTSGRNAENTKFPTILFDSPILATIMPQVAYNY